MRPQPQIVDQHANHVFSFFPVTVGYRGPNAEVFLPAISKEKRLEGGGIQHVKRGAVVTPCLKQRGFQSCRNFNFQKGAMIGLHRRARTVIGQ